MKHKEPKPAGDDEDPEEALKREVAKDPWEVRLKPVLQDKKTRGGMPAWLIRSYDCASTYNSAKPGAPKDNYGCVVVKSLQWPGAFNFYNNGRTHQIYCGDGLKNEEADVS